MYSLILSSSLLDQLKMLMISWWVIYKHYGKIRLIENHFVEWDEYVPNKIEFNLNNVAMICRGVASIDIDLSSLDINQCDTIQPSDAFFNVFRGTHKCPENSEVILVFNHIELWKESLNSDSHQFHKYQQNEQSLVTLFIINFRSWLIFFLQ